MVCVHVNVSVAVCGEFVVLSVVWTGEGDAGVVFVVEACNEYGTLCSLDVRG